MPRVLLTRGCDKTTSALEVFLRVHIAVIPFLLGAVVGLNSARAAPSLAAPSCAKDANITEVEGVATIYSSSDSGDGTETRFENACVERDGWVFKAPLLIVQETSGGNTLQAQQATIETIGAAGTVQRVSGNEKNLEFEGVDLNLEKTYQLEGFAAAKYKAVSQRGRLEGQKLTLFDAILNRLSDGGALQERYTVKSAVLDNGKGLLEGVTYGASNLGVRGQSGSSSKDGVQLQGVSGSLGRNSAGSEVSFTSATAVRLDNGAFRLENATLYLFGLPIGVGNLDYDPECPPELPLRLNVGDGFTIGFENMRVTCDGKVRTTIIANDALSSKYVLQASVSVSDGDFAFYIGQGATGTFNVSLTHEPRTGLVGAYIIDSGGRLEKTDQAPAERYLEWRGGVAQAFSFAPFSFRPKLEVGLAAQDNSTQTTPSSTPPLVFARGTLELGFGITLNPVSLSSSLTTYATQYGIGDPVFNYTLNLNAQANFGWLRMGLGFSNVEQFGTAPINRHNVGATTKLTGNISLKPSSSAPELGFSGIALEFKVPIVALDLIYDLRNGRWEKQRIDFGVNFNVYNGDVPTDHLGNRFQTPLFAVAPRAWWDFAPRTQTGELGAEFTIYGLSLSYNFGAFITFPARGFRFAFGIGLR
jgi:hypothetical protein